MTSSCPCGTTLPYSRCCEPALSGERPPPTAEALMRSRYCAYVMENWRYLYKTWHPQTRPTRKELSRSPSTDWLGLEVLNTNDGSAEDSQGTVEFIARFTSSGKEHSLRELSRFEKLNQGWVYVDGDISA